MTIKLESWASSENRQERHYFIEGVPSGYQPNTYLFGYNPKFVSEPLARTILALIRAEAGL